ncbi:Mitochondrial copper homeostasis protein [Diplodia intermedia]|uniref:Cytochrome c oxidase-assembly factor COX23, mitochondrial n=1 Tax=Diplodia intermedia TaxID=856260 RepID=A0ABR3TL98_9PEZI
MAADDKPENPWTDSAASTFDGKQHSQYFDPCQEAASKSLRCLHRNGGDREMCSDYFQAYRDCKKQWMEARKEAKRKESKSFW